MRYRITYRIELYDGRQQHPAVYPYRTESAETEKQARAIAARMLGHRSLRGASSWGRYKDGGRVFQFGPRTEESEYDYAAIVERKVAVLRVPDGFD